MQIGRASVRRRPGCGPAGDAPVGQPAGADEDQAEQHEQPRALHDRGEDRERLDVVNTTRAAVAMNVSRLLSRSTPSTANHGGRADVGDHPEGRVGPAGRPDLVVHVEVGPDLPQHQEHADHAR